MAVINLTEARIRDLPLGSGIHRDEQVKGLMVICHKTTKTYACQGDVRRNGRHVRTVRATIDRVDRISLKDARAKAKGIMSQIQSGVDPTERPEESGITLERALDAHLEENRLRPRTEEAYRYTLDHYLKPWRKKAVADISRQMVRDLYADIKRKSGETTAAGTMRVLRAVVNTAMRLDETLTKNPVDVLKLPAPKVRKVAPLDLANWWTRVEALSPVRRDYHIASLLTGARRGSLCPVRRADVDLEKRVLTFEHQKTSDEPLLFPMGRRLAVTLSARLAVDEPLRSPWLWPAQSRSGHISEPREDGLPSPHEYRHVARTLLIAAGVPYAESGMLLGHKLGGGATAGYMHPGHLVEHLRPYAQALEDWVFAARPEVPGLVRLPDCTVVDPLGFVVVAEPPERPMMVSRG